MRVKNFICILIGFGFWGLILLTPISVKAELYNANLGFETSNQNMWGGGDSITLEGVYDDLKLEFNEDVTIFDAFTGGVTTIVPSFYVPFVGWTDPVTVDTTTGAKLDGTIRGMVGLEAGYKIDSGSINATYPVSVELTYPDPGTVGPGGSYSISSQYVVDSSAGFDTNFPEIQAYVDLVWDIYAEAELDLAALGAHAIIPIPIADFDGTQEIVAFNRDDDGELRLLGIDTGLVGEEIDLGKYGDFTLTIPDIETTSSVRETDPPTDPPTPTDPPIFESEGETNFFELALDVDNTVTQLIYIAAGIPNAEIELPKNDDGDDNDDNKIELPDSIFAGDFEFIEYDLLDIDAGAELDIEQKFLFEPELWITLANSDGEEVAYFQAGESADDLIMGDSIFDLTPTFTLVNTFTNSTYLSIVPELEIEALSAKAFGSEFGPLYEEEFQFDVFPSIPVYGPDALFGEPFPLAFESFTLASFSIEPGPEPIPEPATIILVGSGLLGLVGVRTRKKKKIN